MDKKKEIRVVLDANIFVSYFLSSGEAIAKIFTAWQEKKFKVLISPEIKAEVLTVFQYPKIAKRITIAEFKALKHLIDTNTIMVLPKRRFFVCKDLPDNMYLECAFEGKADYLVTGDKKHLLPLKKFHRTKIVSPARFKNILTCLERERNL